MPFDYQMVTFEEFVKNDFFKWAGRAFDSASCFAISVNLL